MCHYHELCTIVIKKYSRCVAIFRIKVVVKVTRSSILVSFERFHEKSMNNILAKMTLGRCVNDTWKVCKIFTSPIFAISRTLNEDVK